MRDAAEIVAHAVRAARDHGLSLRAESAVVDYSGWEFFVVHAVAEDGVPWILRVPRQPGGTTERAQMEQRLLALVRDRVPVAVPDWRIVGPDLIAYPRLPGKPARGFDPVTGEVRWVIDRDNPPDQFLVGVARFFAALHKVPVPDAVAAGAPLVPRDLNRERYASFVEFGVDELRMHPAWAERGRRWLDRDDLWSDSTVLIHTDPHHKHTLVDDTGALVGVIDWSNAEVCDPARDFVPVIKSFGVGVLDRLIEVYRHHDGAWWPGLRAHAIEALAFEPLGAAYWSFRTGRLYFVEKVRARFAMPPEDVDTAAAST